VQNIEKLKAEFFDLVVIGGGITGAGVAWDAASRNLKVALLEKSDFASGTSSRSSKMIHGGLRYLKHLDIKLVKESLSEREKLLRLAPHLAHPKPYLLPVYKHSRDKKFEIKIGLIGYDFLARSKSLGHHQMLSKKEILSKEPLLSQEGLTGGFLYYDCVVDDARLTLLAIRTAFNLGAVVTNYTPVTRIVRENNKILAVEFQDTVTGQKGTVKGKVFVNAAGPWVDTIRSMVGIKEPVLRPTKGIHIVVPFERIAVRHTIVLNTDDGRIIFLVPHNGYTYIGTTDTDYQGNLDSVLATREDIDYLLNAVNKELSNVHLDYSDIISSWAGLRPLIRQEGAPSDVSRDYEVFFSGKNLVSIAGGKLTTFRLMGEVLVNQILEKHSDLLPKDIYESKTNSIHLHGGNINGFSEYLRSELEGVGSGWGLTTETLTRLIKNYGNCYLTILGYVLKNKKFLKRVKDEYPVFIGEILYSINEEMTLTLKDFLLHRTSMTLFTHDNALRLAPQTAYWMGKFLGWKRKEIKRQLYDYFQYVSTMKKSF
jgi:glycerol-3-phosphate dehydrogenase